MRVLKKRHDGRQGKQSIRRVREREGPGGRLISTWVKHAAVRKQSHSRPHQKEKKKKTPPLREKLNHGGVRPVH